MTDGTNIRSLSNNRGVIFNHFPELILFASKQNQSEATVLEKIANFATLGNEEGGKIRRENNHSLNQIIKGDTSENHWNKILSNNKNFPDIDTIIGEVDPKTTGGWLLLESAIKGFQAANDKQRQYLNYLLALCDIDKKIIANGRKKDPKNRKNIEDLNKLIQSWFKLPNFDLEKRDKKNEVRLTIAVVLHTTALFERFLSTEYEEMENYSRISECLPLITKNKISYSNEQFLINFKKGWAKNKYDEKDIKWVDLYRDIIKAKTTDSLENQIDPYTDAIKTTFYEWRNGKRFLTISSLKKELLILYGDDPECFDFSLIIIIFIQLFDNVQREIAKLGLSNDFIVDQFSKYPDYLKLVEKRYKQYKSEGIAVP